MSSEYFTRLRNNIKIYYLSSALSGLLFTVPIWVAFHQRYLSYTQMAFIAALSYFVTLILELPTGALADLIGRKSTIILGYLFIGIFRIFLGFATTPVGFYLGWIGEAIGNALVSGADTALLYDTLKELKNESQYSRIVAKSSLFRRSLLVLAVLSGGYFYKIFVGLPFVLRGVAYLLMAISSIFLIEPKIDTYTFNLKNYWLQTKEGVSHLLRSSHTRVLTGYYAVVAGTIWVLQDYFVNTFAKDSGFSDIEQSWAFSSFYLISTLVVLFITKNKDKMPRKNTIYLALPLMLIMALIPGYYASKFIVYFLILTINISSALNNSLLNNYVHEEVDSKYRATALSALNLVVSAVYLLILLATGPLQDLYSNRLVWSVIGLIVLVFAVPFTIKLLQTTSDSTL
jgi:MFS family permease